MGVTLAQAYSLPGIKSSPSRIFLFYGDTVFSIFLPSHMLWTTREEASRAALGQGSMPHGHQLKGIQ